MSNCWKKEEYVFCRYAFVVLAVLVLVEHLRKEVACNSTFRHEVDATLSRGPGSFVTGVRCAAYKAIAISSIKNKKVSAHTYSPKQMVSGALGMIWPYAEHQCGCQRI